MAKPLMAKMAKSKRFNNIYYKPTTKISESISRRHPLIRRSCFPKRDRFTFQTRGNSCQRRYVQLEVCAHRAASRVTAEESPSLGFQRESSGQSPEPPARGLIFAETARLRFISPGDRVYGGGTVARLGGRVCRPRFQSRSR